MSAVGRNRAPATPPDGPTAPMGPKWARGHATGYNVAMRSDETSCPACGGAGGGPFGPPGSAWDDEAYVCPRCRGTGVVAEGRAVARPLAKARGEPGGAATPMPARDARTRHG